MWDKNLLKKDLKTFGWFLILCLIIIYICHFFDIPLCPVQRIFHYPCPFCGTTRASILLLTGHFKEALEMNPLIYECILLCIIFPLFRYKYKKDWIIITYLGFMIISSIFVYIYGMIHFFPIKEPFVPL